MKNKYILWCIAAGVILFIQSCASTGLAGTSTAVQSIKGSELLFATSTIQTTNISLNELRPSDELSQDILKEVSFFAGGAGCAAKTIGVSPRYCAVSEQWPISLKMNGVFRVSDQDTANAYPWWGDKIDACYDSLQVGDMAYFSAFGYLPGEQVKFSIQGPSGNKTYQTTAQQNVEYYGGGACAPYATAPAARLSWVVDPTMGIGSYILTVNGKSGKSSLNLMVRDALKPSFGVSVGDTSLPMVLGPEKTIRLIYSKFQPNEVVTTLLYKPDLTTFSSSHPIRYLNVKMDESGSAVNTIKWDPTLPSGQYWFLVPSLVPAKQSNSKYSDFPIEPALWAVYFDANVEPEYAPEKLYKSMQDILLRSSCDRTLSIPYEKTINLRYGIWGVKGLDLLEKTKGKIITRLFINNKEIAGYRPEKIIPAAKMPCGDKLKNGYFFFNETQIGPFYIWAGDPSQLDVRIEYSFLDTITDGYDLFPKDGKNDLYTPQTSFSQTFKINIAP